MKRNVSVVRFKFRCNILISGKIINEMPVSVASRTNYISCACPYELCHNTRYKVPGRRLLSSCANFSVSGRLQEQLICPNWTKLGDVGSSRFIENLISSLLLLLFSPRFPLLSLVLVCFCCCFCFCCCCRLIVLQSL